MASLPGEHRRRRFYCRAIGALTALAGIFFLIGGAVLLYRGGSAYYVLMGIALTAAAVGIARLRAWGAHLYGLALFATLAWALYDGGWDFWPFMSRVYVFLALGLLITLLYPALREQRFYLPKHYIGWYSCIIFLMAALLMGFAAMSVPKGTIAGAKPAQASPELLGPVEWKHTGGSPGGERYSKASQINTATVAQLQVAWIARTGDIHESDGSGAEDQTTPLQIGNYLYVCTAYGKVVALDPDTGHRKWLFDPQASAPAWQRCRGLAYHEQPGAAQSPEPGKDETLAGAGAVCARRLYLPTVDARLIALDADTGRQCGDFGDAGVVDLSAGMGELQEGWYKQTSPPLVAGNLVIVGGRAADTTMEVPGAVRAFHALSGELVWAWDPGDPSITGAPPAGATYTRNSPNVWTALSHDPELDLVYLGTGNATPTYYGGLRDAQTDATSSAIVALEAATGRLRWIYQTVHHDLWNFDIPAQPLLTDVPDEQGGMQPALVQVTKQGEIFMLNRVTGEPMAAVKELPVPAGNVPGERYAARQPRSVGMPSIGNELLTESDMWGATPFDLLLCRISFKGLRHEGVFTPPGMDPILQYPGSLGGMNWGGASVDPARHYLFVNDMRLGLVKRLIPADELEEDSDARKLGLPVGAESERFLSPLGIPCSKPPFGTLSAIDLKTRHIVWQTPVGTVEHTGPLGIPMRLSIPIGLPTLGPSLATQGGLVFFAGSQDFYLRAWASDTGEELWKGRLPVGSQGGPMTYVSPRTERQYVVVTAGGARLSPKRGDYVVAFALPEP